MEISRPVVLTAIDFQCERCGKGYMRSTGICLTSNPPKWPSRCTDCGYEEVLGQKYPAQVMTMGNPIE